MENYIMGIYRCDQKDRTKVTGIEGIEIDPLTMAEAVERCLKIARNRAAEVPYVVTPNVNHIVLLRDNEEFQKAYKNAILVLTDGKPVRTVLNFFGKPIPEIVPGSDLVPRIFDAVPEEQPITVFLLGAGDGVAERAAQLIQSRWRGVRIVGCYSPPMGFESSQTEEQKIRGVVDAANPDLLVIGLGAPKQELWINKNRSRLNAGVALCVGATIDFLAGEKKRCPFWMRKIALEWLYRIYSEPRRLARRYAGDALIFTEIVWREWRRSH